MIKYKTLQERKEGLDKDINEREFFELNMIRILTDLNEVINKNTTVLYVSQIIIFVMFFFAV